MNASAPLSPPFKRIKVTGILAEDHQLPVFHPTNSDIVQQGIPIAPNTDLKTASHRYLLKEATWEIIQTN